MSIEQVYSAWGRGRHASASHKAIAPRSVFDAIRAFSHQRRNVLAYGRGRSYGDVCLNPGGLLIDCSGLDRFVSFDRESGVLECEAGVSLGDILRVCCRSEPDGSAWFLPVTPGTRFVTVGGAVANDVHGKNHHGFGTFGRHILSFDLARSDGSLLTCSPDENPDLFAATIGGLGLTGLIVRARLQLRRIPGTALQVRDDRFDSLSDFFALADDAQDDWEYTAAWIDCLAAGSRSGRGIFSRARHHPGGHAAPPLSHPRKSMPLTPPVSLVGGVSLRAFNALYWRKLGFRTTRTAIASYEPIFYPLDAIGEWNRLYGPRGFHQFQCAVPARTARDAVADMLKAISMAGEGSMLAVLKTFGTLPSPGLLSFPMEGATLALDFPARGDTTHGLMRRLEEITRAAGGRIYPAKDSMMTVEAFAEGYPRLKEFLSHVDPAASSGFARRVGLLPASSKSGAYENAA